MGDRAALNLADVEVEEVERGGYPGATGVFQFDLYDRRPAVPAFGRTGLPEESYPGAPPPGTKGGAGPGGAAGGGGTPARRSSARAVPLGVARGGRPGRPIRDPPVFAGTDAGGRDCAGPPADEAWKVSRRGAANPPGSGTGRPHAGAGATPENGRFQAPVDAGPGLGDGDGVGRAEKNGCRRC